MHVVEIQTSTAALADSRRLLIDDRSAEPPRLHMTRPTLREYPANQTIPCNLAECLLQMRLENEALSSYALLSELLLRWLMTLVPKHRRSATVEWEFVGDHLVTGWSAGIISRQPACERSSATRCPGGTEGGTLKRSLDISVLMLMILPFST